MAAPSVAWVIDGTSIRFPETAENVAVEFGVSRVDQDLFALRSQQRCKAAKDPGAYSTAKLGAAGRCRARQSERWGDRARPPAGSIWHPPGAYGAATVGGHRG